MKFTIGDETDKALFIALKHEFLRCDEAFRQFASAGEDLIMQGQDRRRAYKAHDAYARFVHHLYEFALCAIARDRHAISTLQAVNADKYIASYLQSHCRRDGTPSWTARPPVGKITSARFPRASRHHCPPNFAAPGTLRSRMLGSSDRSSTCRISTIGSISSCTSFTRMRRVGGAERQTNFLIWKRSRRSR